MHQWASGISPAPRKALKAMKKGMLEDRMPGRRDRRGEKT
jgi:hypothetical protein